MSAPFHLFERYGVELEYMIVDSASLNVRPIADKIVHAVGLGRKNEVKHGNLRWSNELVLHVIELKTDGPARSLDSLATDFQKEVRYLNGMLADYACCLLPTAMHPWMDPHTETRLWPHGDRAIYQAFDRIFDCRGHGWSNLQSTHINLPFHGDEEFRRLHSAIRLILPLIPALAASSPIVEGKIGPKLDMRLEHYRHNCARIPSITGRVIPERIHSPAEYAERILQRMYADIAPHDPEGILRDEWLNARGAIARFERGTIEIRVLDIQENPAVDLAIVQFIVAILKALVSETLSPLKAQEAPLGADLADTFLQSLTTGSDTLVNNAATLNAFGLADTPSATLNNILWHLLRRVATLRHPWRPLIEKILRQGCLARRIRRALPKAPNRAALHTLYDRLAACLHNGEFFEA
ncbi:MAG: hypothetical protein JJT96_00145 [Opitutales bacterium]|nr:hypothetical protein [Opitutales bacterium]